jgi:hypothetical protein
MGVGISPIFNVADLYPYREDETEMMHLIEHHGRQGAMNKEFSNRGV